MMTTGLRLNIDLPGSRQDCRHLPTDRSGTSLVIIGRDQTKLVEIIDHDSNNKRCPVDNQLEHDYTSVEYQQEHCSRGGKEEI
jgi:hypothetical protein